MDKFAALPTKQKIIAGIGIGTAVLVIFIASVSFTSPKSKPSETAAVPTGGANSQNTSTGIGGVTPTQEAGVYKGQYVSVSYPSGWVKESGPVAGGGEFISFKLQGVTAPPPYPRVTIQATPSHVASLSGQINFYTQQNFVQTQTTIDKNPAVQFTGVIPLSEPVHETGIILQKGDIVYVIRTQFQGVKPLPETSGAFDLILKSIKLGP
ncbi:MAG TPA: hypothetical protein VLF68_04580 [Candidatus Saccharimonadales bacterium]|nr:hypothetical protein [Candidatus Saccharimonadales bacterium]